MFNYILSMKYVFVHKEDMSRRREFVIFSVLSAIGLGLNGLYMFICVNLRTLNMSMKPSPRFRHLVQLHSRRKFLDAGHAEPGIHARRLAKLDRNAAKRAESRPFFICAPEDAETLAAPRFVAIRPSSFNSKLKVVTERKTPQFRRHLYVLPGR
ncbi:MAG: GtrA family protein [Collinsella aerofaciens]